MEMGERLHAYTTGASFPREVRIGPWAAAPVIYTGGSRNRMGRNPSGAVLCFLPGMESGCGDRPRAYGRRGNRFGPAACRIGIGASGIADGSPGMELRSFSSP